MQDLTTALATMTLVSLAISLASYRATRNTPAAHWLFGGLLLSALLFERLLADRLFWAQLLPDSSATIVWSNATPLLLAAAFGVAMRICDLPQTGHRVAAGLTAILAVAAMVAPVVRPYARPVETAQTEPLWSDGVCLQTQDSTCGPAAAATLLRFHHLWATEATMNPLCLTGRDGTSSLGVYRGVYNVANTTGYQPRAICGSYDEFVQSGQFPAIVMVRYPEQRRDWKSKLLGTIGRRSGEGHVIVVFGPNAEGQLDVGDPAVGRSSWDVETLKELWDGEAIYLQGGQRYAANAVNPSAT
ncbi:Peptidase C39 family protein [Rosistilla ulvae]|uniref:Peptidase C39 family protein n=1 Tax=Rosistilla ulvae TaxID=1930277 RepID=A0A517M6X3_9BACT|nr:cysteine peptidase family C39 domain-containing protein [Rosistilla ulvae]QDS90629.1 Peptidase C39 family protein [Rosistilla ulvae]